MPICIILQVKLCLFVPEPNFNVENILHIPSYCTMFQHMKFHTKSHIVLVTYSLLQIQDHHITYETISTIVTLNPCPSFVNTVSVRELSDDEICDSPFNTYSFFHNVSTHVSYKITHCTCIMYYVLPCPSIVNTVSVRELSDDEICDSPQCLVIV